MLAALLVQVLLFAGDTTFGPPLKDLVRLMLHDGAAQQAALRRPCLRGAARLIPRSDLEELCQPPEAGGEL